MTLNREAIEDDLYGEGTEDGESYFGSTPEFQTAYQRALTLASILQLDPSVASTENAQTWLEEQLWLAPGGRTLQSLQPILLELEDDYLATTLNPKEGARS